MIFSMSFLRFFCAKPAHYSPQDKRSFFLHLPGNPCPKAFQSYVTHLRSNPYGTPVIAINSKTSHLFRKVTVPSLIFRAQARLGLSAVQLALLLHLVDYWWKHAQMPFPNKATLAERMNLSPRQIQRYLTELETAEFIKREERFAGHRGQQSNIYHLDGLVKRLKKLEPEFSEVQEQAIEQAKNVAKRGGLAARRASIAGRAKKTKGDDE